MTAKLREASGKLVKAEEKDEETGGRKVKIHRNFRENL